MVSDLRMPAESDNESMADYADGVGDGESYLVLLVLVSTVFIGRFEIHTMVYDKVYVYK